MPSLDQLTKPPPPAEAEHHVLGGTLVARADGLYLKVGTSAALYGPLATSAAQAPGSAATAIDQDGTPWLLGGGTSEGNGGNIDGGRPDSIYGGTYPIDGEGV